MPLENLIQTRHAGSKPKLTLGAYEVHTAPEGFANIRHVASGEVMHSRMPPEEEARRIYVEQSNLAERLRESREEDGASLTLWDVGLGAAANAMGAIRCYEEEAARGPVRSLRIISFENDLDSLRLAMMHKDKFGYLRHSALGGILAAGTWQSRPHPGLTWSLVRGDLRKTMAAAPGPPDIIYYDMYSRKTSAEHWTINAFRQLFEFCRGRPAELFTYTFSTAARAALLAAGFYVAKGRSVVDRDETTIAFTPEAFLSPSARRHQLLSSDWLAKWGRSTARFPAEIGAHEKTSFTQIIREHPQFQGS